MKFLSFATAALLWLVGVPVNAQTDPPQGRREDPLDKPATFLGEQRERIYADIETNKGLIEAELDPEHAPLTTLNFVGLAEGTLPFTGRPKATGFYDGTTFHRVVKDFVIQGGDPASADPTFPADKLGEGGPGYSFPDEFSPRLRHDTAGVLSMANDGPDTNGSQFFITLREVNRLNYLHSVFGQVVRGMDVVNRIEQGDKILHITIRRSREKKEVARIDDPATGQPPPSPDGQPREPANTSSPSTTDRALVATPEAFETLKQRVLSSRRPGPGEGFFPLVDETKQLPDLRVKNFNYKLANYQRTTGHRIVVRILPASKDDSPGQSAGSATKQIAVALGLADTGDNALVCYYAAGGAWSLRLGEATYPALIDEAGTTDQLMASGALHRGKTELLRSAETRTKAGQLKESVDAAIDTLILKLDDFALQRERPQS